MRFKQLKIPFISTADHQYSLNAVKSVLKEQNKDIIEFSPWLQYPYSPEVSFSIAYSDDSILLNYYVKEEVTKAEYTRINDPVYKDSCVEFFIAFGAEENYYNLEFNCTGTGLVGFGRERGNRKLLPYSSIKKIQTQTAISTSTCEGSLLINWELTLIIPFKTFYFHNISSLKGEKCRVNFYKCGDDLPKPHFLCWNAIISEIPNFHLPFYFGEAEFLEEK